MRDPAIHITLSILKKLLKEKKVDNFDSVAEYILKIGYKYNLTNRHIIYSRTKTIDKKLKKKLELNTKYVGKFNLTLEAERMAKNHRFVKTINNSDREYSVLCEVTQDALEFTDLYNLGMNDGFKSYISAGLEIIGKNYALNKFKYHKERIFEFYKNCIIIQEDDNVDNTRKFYSCFKDAMYRYVGVNFDINEHKKNKVIFASKYISLIYGRQEADSVNATYRDWIEAQFVRLSWLNAVPELTQLYGDNAKERYEKYMLENKKINKNDGRKLEENLKMSESEKEYWNRINSKKKEGD